MKDLSENNYIKKYALMKLENVVGYDPVTGMMEVRPYAYVVAECYLIDEKVVFKEGKMKTYYEVVFTWEPFSDRSIIPQVTPNNFVVNSDIVDRVFDNLEDAIDYRVYRNYDLKVLFMMKSDVGSVYQTEVEFLERLDKAYELEERHLLEIKGKIKERTKKVS